MDIVGFARGIGGFANMNHPEKIKCFGWFLHTHRDQDRFMPADIRACYDEAHLNQPANMGRFLESLTEKKPPELLRDKRGYRLAQAVRETLDRRLGAAPMAIAVEKILADLPGKISDAGERLFLNETIACYRASAFRAAIVMAWNLAYDHLLRWILADAQRLAEFNAGIPKRNPKKSHVGIINREDFEELKEDETVDIVVHVGGFPSGIKKILKEKLGRRNTYAHPSTLVVERAQVDDMITDLVNNVVLRLAL